MNIDELLLWFPEYRITRVEAEETVRIEAPARRTVLHVQVAA